MESKHSLKLFDEMWDLIWSAEKGFVVDPLTAVGVCELFRQRILNTVEKVLDSAKIAKTEEAARPSPPLGAMDPDDLP